MLQFHVLSAVTIIINIYGLFWFVLQQVGQEVEHCGAYYHAFFSFVNPIANPNGICFSYGYTIGSACGLLRFTDNAQEKDIAYQKGAAMKAVDISVPQERRSFQKAQATIFAQAPAKIADRVESLRDIQSKAPLKAKETKEKTSKKRKATQFSKTNQPKK
jgi:hypothetical protein